MKRKYYTYILSTLLGYFMLGSSNFILAQNLVPNHNFDAFVRCPNSRGQIDLAQPWYSPNGKTTDFVHDCDWMGFAGVPVNNWGFQDPLSGNGYAGIRTWLNGDSQDRVYREYLAVELIDSLQAGQEYLVLFYVSPGDSSKFVTDDIGIYFSHDSIPDLDLLPYRPHVRNPEGRFLRSATRWTKIEGQYTASGGEKHLVIGNFLNHDATDIERRNIDIGFESTYLFIDEVVVEPCRSNLPSQLIFTADSSLCPGATTLLTTPRYSEATYSWSEGTSDTSITVTTPGSYSVSVKLGGCTYRDTLEITAAPVPDFDLGNDTLLCPASRLEIGLNEEVDDYRWSDRHEGLQRTVDEAGLYILEVFEGNCSFQDSIRVEFEEVYKNPPPFDSLICKDTPLELKASYASAAYFWSDLSEGESLKISEAGEYWVNVETDCFSAREYFSIATENCGCESFIPNVFSPNGDGIQDRFEPQFTEGIDSYSIEIFDAVGRRLFTSQRPDEFWEGKLRGKQVQEGVYYYAIQYSCVNTGKFIQEVKKGYVSLLR
ncbi:MAG: gliding motility-associated C-terminal domain-containing protein [Bacteroidota bacterium]